MHRLYSRLKGGWIWSPDPRLALQCYLFIIHGFSSILGSQCCSSCHLFKPSLFQLWSWCAAGVSHHQNLTQVRLRSSSPMRGRGRRSSRVAEWSMASSPWPKQLKKVHSRALGLNRLIKRWNFCHSGPMRHFWPKLQSQKGRNKTNYVNNTESEPTLSRIRSLDLWVIEGLVLESLPV